MSSYTYSDRPLPDPDWYEGGWKAPKVDQYGRIRRAFSGFDGQYESSDFTITYSDTDRFLRELHGNSQLVNADFVFKMIEDEDRRLELPWSTRYRGIIRDAKPRGTLLFDIQVKDTFAEKFSGKDPQPQRIVITDDFPNCNVPLVSCSASGYLVNGSFAAGVDTVDIDTGAGHWAPGQKFTFAGHATVYQAGAVTDGPALPFSPVLTDPVADNEAITLVPSFTVQTSAGKRVPFGYGFITDRNITTGDDSGDGQGPVLYVGDRVLSDGRTYGEFLWVGHACHSGASGPGDAFTSPFAMLYFWNNALEFDNFFYYSGEQVIVNALDVEAGSSGRAAVPGYDLWDDLGFTDTYVDYNGRRYTVLFLNGVLRDMALGILPAPDLLGGVPFAVNAYLAAENGDGTGGLITSGLQQYKHLVKNWIPPRGDCYQSGDWLDTDTFPDDPTLLMIDEASFDTAEAQSELYMGTSPAVPYRGDFLVGANDEKVTARELVARLNVSFGVDCGFNRHTQFFVSMINTDLATTTLVDPLGYERDIFAGTFAIEPQTREQSDAIDYRHTKDYLGREQDGWRSVISGITQVGTGIPNASLQLHMIRGKNRTEDPDVYLDGSATATAVLAMKLARIQTIPHIVKLTTGPAGFNYELGDVFLLTHYEGLDTNGWTDRPMRVERVEDDPTTWTATLECYDLTPMLV